MRLQENLMKCWLAVTTTFVVSTTSAHAQHFDISPRVENGKIVADAFDDGSGMTVATNVSAFGYDFQEDPLDPFFIGDPGFNAISGSGLPVGGRFGFDMVNGADFGLVGNATYWDGTGPVSFGSLPTGVSLSLGFGSQSVTALNTTGVQEGFFFGSEIDSGGTYHHHLNSTLDDATLGDDDGIYLIGWQFKVDSDGGDPPFVGDLFSNPIWIVYNNGLSEEIHDEAIDWVQTNLAVPEPSSVILVGLAATMAPLLRRRKHRAKRLVV